MDIDWDGITHVTKVDPAEALPAALDVLTGTDLVIVGGSNDVTEVDALETIRAIRRTVPSTPVLQEPSSSAHVSVTTVEAVDALAIPAVYNGDRAHFVGNHVDAFTEVGRTIADVAGSGGRSEDFAASIGDNATTELASKLLGEGYVVQNLESAAATTAGVDAAYAPERVAGAALATETFYDFPIFYVEYSGTYGGPEDVEAAARYLEETTLFYGGGIDSREKATEILEAGADAIVVGDCFHDDPETFRETIPEE